MARDGDLGLPPIKPGQIFTRHLVLSPPSHSHPLYDGFPSLLVGCISLETHASAQQQCGRVC